MRFSQRAQSAAPETREIGAPRDLILYTSAQSHSSVEKDAMALGIGQSNVRKIEADEAFRMQPHLLQQAIQQDRAAGRHPFCGGYGRHHLHHKHRSGAGDCRYLRSREAGCMSTAPTVATWRFCPSIVTS